MIDFSLLIKFELAYYIYIQCIIFYLAISSKTNIQDTELLFFYDFVFFTFLSSLVLNNHKKILYLSFFILVIFNTSMYTGIYLYNLKPSEHYPFLVFSIMLNIKNILKIIIYPQYLKEDDDDKKPLLSPCQSTETIALSV